MIQFTTASILGLLTFFIGVPAVAIVLCAMPKLVRPALAVMVFTTCMIKKPFYMEVFFQPYRGVDRGFGVTIPDLIILTMGLKPSPLGDSFRIFFCCKLDFASNV